MKIFITSGYAKIFLIFALLVATNRWPGFHEGIDHLKILDAWAYQQMAKSAPGFSDEKIVYHHGQRFIPHWITGVVKKATGLKLEAVYTIIMLLITLGTLLLLFAMLEPLGLSEIARVLLVGVFAFNPYSIRYYLLAPVMIADMLFALGMVLIVNAAITKRTLLLVFGIVLSGICRQTVMLALPGLVLWNLFVSDERRMTKRLVSAAVPAVAIVLVYFSTIWLASSFLQPPCVSFMSIFTIFPWMLSPEFSLSLFVEHLVRVFIPFIIPAGLIAASLFSGQAAISVKDRRFLILVIIAAGIVSFSLLPGPLLQRQNQSRFSGMALVPVIFATGYFIRTIDLSRVAIWIKVLFWAGLLTGSIHHMYSRPSPSGLTGYLVLQGISFVVCTVAFYLAARRKA